MSPLVWNERLKFQANALDRASTASLVLGVLGPLATEGWTVGAGLRPLGWFILGAVLHLAGYWLLGSLRS